MKVLITGASSGIGKSMAKIFAKEGHDLILVARGKRKLEMVAKELNANVEIIDMDISSTYNCMELYNRVKKEKIDVLINNAGFGLFGKFDETKIDRELDMIDLNIKAVHTLTKLFLKDFKKRDSGYILNVASIAGFLPGPLMATYYSTKAYVLNFTLAIREELRQDCSNVYVGALCPGPVNTAFNDVAKVNFALKGLESDYVADYAIKKMFKNKKIIVPGKITKIGMYLSKILPYSVKLKYVYKIQKKKA